MLAKCSYGTDSFLRFQLRHKIRTLKADDQRILWEGIESLTKMELREACQERGMRSTGLSKEAYKRSLQQWLELSVHKNVPTSLLIMSRIFFLQEETIATGDDEFKSVAGLADAISGMDKEVVNEVILEVATSEEKKSNPDVRKIKLEVLTHQNEKIKEEQAEREAAAKKKESSSEKSEQESAAEPLLVTVDELPTDAPDAGKSRKISSDQMEDVIVGGSDVSGTIHQEESTTEADNAEEQRADSDLSADEMEAIVQLLSADPVSKEREELERIKAAIQKKVDSVSNQPEELAKIKSAIEEQVEDKNVVEALGLNIPGNTSTYAKHAQSIDNSDEYAANRIHEMDNGAKEEADKATIFSTSSEIPHTTVQGSEMTAGPEEAGTETSADSESEEPEDPIVARLKKRIESMVDKIEVQLSDVQVKIGDKLHFLDKDMDGILSPEEMAEVLHQVLKRNISMEEALEIANQIVSV
jgi:hypothetical protein